MKVPILLCTSGTTPAPRISRITSAPPSYSHTSQLAHRLQQNWLARHPTDTCSNGGISLDDSLTSLSWLQNLNIFKITSPTPPPSPPCTVFEVHRYNQGGSSPSSLLAQPNMGSLIPIQHHRLECQVPLGDGPPFYGTSLENVDYRTNPHVKPPYSYATLICMAMKETRKHKITLSAIYNWITDNFMYYHTADPSWQNSIRHNLSLNKCFQKVPRRKDEPGKGGFWRINPKYSDMIENGIFKKRRNSRDTCSMPPTKRVKYEEDELLTAVNSIKGTREDKLLSNSSARYSHQDDSDEDSSNLRGDLNWTAILNQDIEIGGIRVKTEQIIDNEEPGPLLAMSPPSSESNSDELGLDDLFSQTDISMDMPLDCTTHNPLDLTVTGRGIRPPEWWADILHETKTEPAKNERSSGLNTPVLPSPRSEPDDTWSSASGLGGSGSFDLDNLFDIGNIPSPTML